MAKQKNSPEGTAPEADVTAGQENGKPKNKIERIFTSSNLNELRKKENSLNWKFNRAFNQVKKMGVSAEGQEKIKAILLEEHKAQSAELFKGQTETAGEESFV